MAKTSIKQLENKKRYYKENKELILQQRKKRYSEKKEQILAYKKEYYLLHKDNNKEKKLQKGREYYYKNKDKISKKHNEYNLNNKENISFYHKKHYKENKEKILKRGKIYYSMTKESRRNTVLKRKYSIDNDYYNILFNNQNGRCLGCGKHQSEIKKILCVDHDHLTGKVRGLLCDNCNKTLGMCGENSDTLFRLYTYLKQNEDNNK